MIRRDVLIGPEGLGTVPCQGVRFPPSTVQSSPLHFDSLPPFRCPQFVEQAATGLSPTLKRDPQVCSGRLRRRETRVPPCAEEALAQNPTNNTGVVRSAGISAGGAYLPAKILQYPCSAAVPGLLALQPAGSALAVSPALRGTLREPGATASEPASEPATQPTTTPRTHSSAPLTEKQRAPPNSKPLVMNILPPMPLPCVSEGKRAGVLRAAHGVRGCHLSMRACNLAVSCPKPARKTLIFTPYTDMATAVGKCGSRAGVLAGTLAFSSVSLHFL